MDQPILNQEPPVEQKKNSVTRVVLAIAALAAVALATFFINKYLAGQKNGQVREQQVQENKCPYATDQEAYKLATQGMDKSICDCIKNEENKNICVKTISEVDYYSKAIETTNLELCNQIVEPSRKEACLNVVGSKIEFLKGKE